ncbi:50S ribosomal protein L10 [Clostridiales bacterium PH28_bin88]|nr:50S ribosomal protein L10 [Clostridiales bacterium PH28_bin88]
MAVKQQRLKKEATVTELQDKLTSASSAVLTDYRGLNVAEVTRLRAQLREAGIEYRVVKNTLTRLAAHEAGITGLDRYLEGPTAIAVSLKDPVAPAKILIDFAKASKKLEIKAGLLQGKVIDASGVKALADLPSREQLLAKVLGGMQAPMSGLVNVLAGPLRNFVYVLDAVRKQKEAS